MRFELLFTTVLSAVAASAAATPKRQISTDPAAMQNAVISLQEAVQTIHVVQEGLRANIDPVVASWQGDAAQAFQQAMAQADEAINNLGGVWSQLAEMLNSVGQSYEETEEQNVDRFDSSFEILEAGHGRRRIWDTGMLWVHVVGTTGFRGREIDCNSCPIIFEIEL